MPQSSLEKVFHALEYVYGPLRSLSSAEILSWSPPPLDDGHNGRYLWSDAFGLLVLVTLSSEIVSDSRFLTLAKRLAFTVHDVLGKTRDGLSPLPRGGLRIGKLDKDGPEGDGQYHHYLTLWSFALTRLALALSRGGDKEGAEEHARNAEKIMRDIHPHFFVPGQSTYDGRPRTIWKMSTDLSLPLVRAEGNLDAFDGLVTCHLIRRTLEYLASRGELDLSLPIDEVMKKEELDYLSIVSAKYERFRTDDALDLGMTLFTSHWLADSTKESHKWALFIANRALESLSEPSFLSQNSSSPSPSSRLAFREFGTVLGIRCFATTVTNLNKSSKSLGDSESELSSKFSGAEDFAQTVVQFWEDAGYVPIPKNDVMKKRALESITLLMYCAAILPGAFRKDFFGL